MGDRIEADVARVLSALPVDFASRERRYILGIAGPPASGKSTLAVALRDALNAGPAADGTAGVAAVAALDGFHYDDRILHARGHRLRKGAPLQRWLVHGYGPAEAKEKTEANDLVNARLVAGRSVEPDLRLGP